MNIETVNELIQSLESAGELSIREQKFLKLAKEFRICSASLDAAIKTGNMLADQNAQLAADNVALRNSSSHVLQSGEPPKTYREEWFIARVKGRGFAVLRSLPEEYSYDYTTLDATYFRKDLIIEWMQLPNSEFLPNVKTPATDRIVAGIKADGVEMFVEKCREESMRAISSDIRNNWWLAGEHAEDFAAKLREGADK